MCYRSDQQSLVLRELYKLIQESNQIETRASAQFEELRAEVLRILYSLRDSDWKRHGESSNGEVILEELSILTKEGADRIEDLSRKLSAWTEEGERVATEQHILSSLCFRSMMIRHSQIAEAHAKTFEWMFSMQEDDTPGQYKFVDWLQYGSSFYWITGKAGSGKSTLMKFLCDDIRTKTALAFWARDKTLAKAGFFFWNAGTEMQKSQQGLLQSLLFEVLRQCPILIPTICPSRWQHRVHLFSQSSPWSRAELREAFEALKKQNTIPARLCFFIDGLDEYEGDHTELVNVLQTFTTSPDVKICVSSRPWNIFELAFGQEYTKKLHVEDLTRDDIKLYVQNTLEENPLYRHLKKRDNRCEALVQEIVEKANGVFLWVFLVVRSLLQGLTNADRVSDLQRRLRLLPADLEHYFQHMLDSVDKVYQEQAAEIFQITLGAPEPLSLMTMAFLDDEDDEYTMKTPIQSIITQDLWWRLVETKKRLNARCTDLLEVSFCGPREMKGLLDSHAGFIPGFRLESNDILFSAYKVDFLHRTVRDFLTTKHIQDTLSQMVSPTFRLGSVLCRAFLAQIKSLPVNEEHLLAAPPIIDLVRDMIYYAREAETQDEIPQTEQLDELASVFSSYTRTFSRVSRVVQLSDSSAEDGQRLIKELISWPLGFAAQCGLHLYVAQKLDELPGIYREQYQRKEGDLPLLAKALHPCPLLRHTSIVNPHMVRVLLDRGAKEHLSYETTTTLAASQHNKPDLNMKSTVTATIWAEFLHSVSDGWVSSTPASKAAHLESINILLDAGANSNERISGRMLWADLLMTIADKDGLDGFLHPFSKTLDMFLAHGADPNGIHFDSHTVWCTFLTYLRDASQSPTRDLQKTGLRFAKQFFRYGADPYISCGLQGHLESEGFRTASEFLQSIFPGDEVNQLDRVFHLEQKEHSRSEASEELQMEKAGTGEGFRRRGWTGWAFGYFTKAE